MTEQVQSKYNVGDKVSWRSCYELKGGTGKIFKIKLNRDNDYLYFFTYLVEYDDTEERVWVTEYDIVYQMHMNAYKG